MSTISRPGTIDDLVADAIDQGHHVTVRLVRDWTERGLLDYPQRRPAGKGHGSRPALYSASQRNLFLSLLQHRPHNKISSLARIPVGVWTYWGDDYVPTSQARRAMTTWLGDPRASKQQARRTAQEILRQLDHPAATAVARRRLLHTLGRRHGLGLWRPRPSRDVRPRQRRADMVLGASRIIRQPRSSSLKSGLTRDLGHVDGCPGC